MEGSSKIITYKVDYIAGIVNSKEYSIEIESIVDLTDDFIKSEIDRQRPNHKGQIQQIFNPIRKGEKNIINNFDDIRTKVNF